MKEGTPIDNGLASLPERQDLHPLEWADLVARFAAARELRSAWRRTAQRDAGSFARFANRGVAPVNAKASPVNHADLVDGKADAAKTVSTAMPEMGGAGPGDRELR
ncbi:hypothetical protein [Parerythrobacter lacustris]|uniref:Uncharacterized protein n=1 Tax=Parerythrobacter lacustris TaxID=2969984 RepID=A0ABT1XRU3_9SPHN|nr:hypothetical protein [Parerythrobacter lacustris]MCR2834379.1 hypothetical protein [Parerythrobacter lacustris]